MGYTTEFTGSFKLNKKLDQETHTFLRKLSETRRMKRHLPEKYGIEGEFFVDGSGFAGQDRDPSIIDYNYPPSTQPSLWCNWTPTDDGTEIVWNGGEKFYEYIDWIKYIINKILNPRGYKLTGEVEWIGEDRDDLGKIIIKKNVIKIKTGKVTYE